MNWRPLDRFTFTAGARYSRDEKSLVSRQFFDFTAFGGPTIPITPVAGVPGATGRASDSWNSFTPKLGVSFQANPKTFIYATFSRGFRAGGFNGRLAVPGPIRSFAPDENSTYELGTKTDLFKGRARLNLAGFYSTYENIQLRITDPVVQFYVANAAKAELLGFEAEGNLFVTDRFRLDINLGYTHSEFTEVGPGLIPARVIKGNQLSNTPDWTLGAAAQYEQPIANGGALTARIDVRYLGDQYFQPANQPGDLQTGYALLNAPARLARSA